MAKKYYNEREGQIDFFDNYGIPYEDDDSILVDNTDGVYNGNLFEFKLHINDLNKVLFQAIKYLSKLRVKGESVPATILLIDLNDTKVYEYKSIDYIKHIQKIYVGASSKENEGFTGNKPSNIYDYSEMLDSSKLKKILKDTKTIYDMYIPIDIDENCIVGWAERYYREMPNAKKGDFLGDETGQTVKIIGEIREPKHFKGLINSYTGRSNEKFKYLMDCLNDRLSKKDLGAFYTPIPYAKKSAELVEMAVKRALEAGKKDYIILDRCAGTGNLESALIGLYDSNGDELISHCIVSTYEYYEYKVLNERIGDKVRDIIPPTEAEVIYENGKVSNADAMSEDFINNPIIKQYLDNEDCAIILFENPPYRDITASDKVDIKTKSYIYNEFKKNGTNQSAHREISNLFIWSGFKYYLRQPSDSYVIFSPIKYYKYNHLVNKKFIDGYIFNRKHFHAQSSSSISCILWANNEVENQKICLPVHDIEKENIINIKEIEIKKIFSTFNKYNDKRKFDDDKPSSVFVDYSTGEQSQKITNKKSIYNNTIIGYLRATSINLNAMSRCLTRTITYDALTQAYGFYLRNDNYLEKLPLFVAKLFPQDNWYEKDVYFTSADGGDKYITDKEFLKSCLIYTCLSNQNKCLTFDGSDGRHYPNELCFDEGTLASKDLATMTLDEDEKELLELWYCILEEARATGKCNPNWTYGVYQITKDINTFKKTGTGKNKKTIYDYPKLNGDLDSLRTKLKEYYKIHITDKMFEYELLK